MYPRNDTKPTTIGGNSVMCLNFDIMSRADNYSSEWECFLDSTRITLSEVIKMFNKKQITKEELEYAKDYLKEKLL